MNRYQLAYKLTEPLRRARLWLLEHESWEGWGDPNWEPSSADLANARPQLLVKRMTALVHVWLSRNGDYWTFLLALKVTVCLLLNWRHQRQPWEAGYAANCGHEVAWWSDESSAKYVERTPGEWSTLSVSTGWRRWWFKIEDDFDDSRYP